jgi:hypothetical protein
LTRSLALQAFGVALGKIIDGAKVLAEETNFSSDKLSQEHAPVAGRLSNDVLTDRFAMLADVSGRVSLMKRDLAVLLRSCAHSDWIGPLQ